MESLFYAHPCCGKKFVFPCLFIRRTFSSVLAVFLYAFRKEFVSFLCCLMFSLPMLFRPRNYSGLIHGRLQRQLEMGIAVSFFSRFKTVWLSSFSSFWKELMACSERFLRWVPLSHWPSGALIASTVARSGGDCFPLISEVPRTLQGFVLCQDHFSLGHFPF